MSVNQRVMRMKGLNKLLVPCVVGLLAFNACTSIDCSIDNIVEMNVAIPDTLTDDTLDVFAIVNGTDTAVYTNGLRVTSLSLPLSYDHDVDEFLFAFTDTTGTTTIDTVRIAKTNQSHFESVDCTPQFWHNITGVSTTHNVLDSVTINNPNVDNDQTKTHINIYPHSR